MPGDISRKLFDHTKNYSGVRMQQGRVQLDADLNEQFDIDQYRLHTQTEDVIGENGVPALFNDGNSFQISADDDLKKINFKSGRMYVGGLLCVSPEGGSIQFKKPVDPNKAYLVYIEAWNREINHLNDPSIKEVALGGPDTTTRLKTEFRIDTLELKKNDGYCTSVYDEWIELTEVKPGKLEVRPSQNQLNNADPCYLSPDSTYRRGENQLYRIEIHKEGLGSSARFKWSRDNASVETKIEEDKTNPNKVTVGEIKKDEVLGFFEQDWVEFIDENAVINFSPHQLYKIKYIYPDTNTIQFEQNLPAELGKKGQILRKWDQKEPNPALLNDYMNAVPCPTNWMEIEAGIEIQFDPKGNYKVGDYWLIPARVNNGLQYPKDAQPPIGIKRHYCKLGIIKIVGNKPKVDDCRPIFHPLTQIKSSGGSCTYSPEPGPGWESVFDRIPEKTDAHICLKAGIYPLPENGKVISRKGHLKISGAGKATKIIAENSETGLIFESCTSILARDFYIETQKTGSGKKTTEWKLNGGINCLFCFDVHIDSVSFKNGAGKKRDACCLNVHHARFTRILNCNFLIGHLQQGLLLVDTADVIVENNTFQNYSYNLKYTISELAMNSAGLKKALFPGFKTEKRKADGALTTPAKTDIQATLENKNQVWFSPETKTQKMNQDLLKSVPPEATRNLKSLNSWYNAQINKVLLNLEASYKKYPDLKKLLEDFLVRDQTVAAQAITIGGRTADNIKISQNIMEDTLAGIHVGVSHHGKRSDHDFCNAVHISNNSVKIKLHPLGDKMARHGIFVGNCKNLCIEGNQVSLQRFTATQDTPIDGIRAWGVFGSNLKVMNNTVKGLNDSTANRFSLGIHIHPLLPKDDNSQWIAMWNNAGVKLENGVTDPGYVIYQAGKLVWKHSNTAP